MVEIAHHPGILVERQDIINISRTGRPRAPRLEAGATLIDAALDLLDDPQELYRQPTTR
jgi:hypothetical protein